MLPSATTLTEIATWQKGERIKHRDPRATMVGTLVEVLPAASIPVAVVDWDSGYRGHHTATTLETVQP